MPSRRTFLGQLGAGCAAGLATSFLRGTTTSAANHSGSPMPKNAPFRFIAVNDLHHGTPECTAFLERLVAQMRTHGPVDFCLIIGDLTDNGQEAGFTAVRDAFAKLDAPVYTVPGNHDCDVTQDTSLYAKWFPGRLNYTFNHRGWQFIALDTTDGTAWRETHVGTATLDFIDRTVPALDPEEPTLVFSHFPLAPVPRLTPLNAAEVLARFDPLNLRAVLCGHYHAHTETSRGDAAVVTHPCCSRVRSNHDNTRAEGYVLCTAHPDGRFEREFIEFAEASRQEDPAP